MRRNPGRRTRIAWVAVIVCAVIAVAVGAAAAAWRSSSPHPAALPHPTCGSAITHFLTGRTQLLSADPGALTCFAKAAQQCRSASVGVTEMGVDTGTNYVFAIEPGGTSCKVNELSQYYSANFGGSRSKVSTVHCRRDAVTRAGVVLGCAGRDVLIPSKVSVPSPRSA